MRILIKYPTRSRPELFKQCVQQWTEKASGKHELQWLVSIDNNDATMNNPAMREWCAARGIAIYSGDNANKIAAFNADMDKARPWDVLVLMSDDAEPLVNGWDDVIASHMPANLDCGLWFPDGKQLRLNTFSIFGRPIYERYGYIYHPAFKSVYADDWYQLLLQRDGKMKFIKDPIHRHAWREQNNDALMLRNEAKTTYRADEVTFKRLKQEAGFNE